MKKYRLEKTSRVAETNVSHMFAPQNNGKFAPQIRTGLHGLCIVMQTENSIVTQNRHAFSDYIMLDKIENLLLHKSDRSF
jgi:hypothetical protein